MGTTVERKNWESVQRRFRSGSYYRELAIEVVNCTNKRAKVVINGINTPENVNRYVPSVERIFKELGISQSVLLPQAILRTSTWLKEMGKYNER